jgi:Importin-beta N-terminal domain
MRVRSTLQRAAAEKALKGFQEHPDAWTRVDTVLEKAKTQQTKFFALQASTTAPQPPPTLLQSHRPCHASALTCSTALQRSFFAAV